MSNDFAGGRIRTYAVWGVGLATYLLAVFHRSSLAVAGLAANERFGISATQLAAFVMLQLVVYAAMQVPVGVLVDRFGPRAVLLTGTTLLAVSQVGFALADSYALALVARVGVGLGDALTFICVLRLVASWFPLRQVPFMTQLTGTLGQSGAILAAVPMTWALRELGWERAYLLAATLGFVLALALALVVRDTPSVRTRRGEALSVSTVRANLAAAWRHPGTRLGFWMHFATPFSSNALTLLWGYPFFVRAEGRTSAEAGLLLTGIVVSSIVAGPVLGWLVGRFAYHRSSMVLGIVAAMVAVWTAVLAWPHQAPLWLLAVLVVVVGVAGPASMIGFDVGRTSNPDERLGSATGLINQGGFYASLLLVVGIGLVLDGLTPAGLDYTTEAFRWAMSLQYLLWGVGLVQIWRFRVQARRHARAGGPSGAPDDRADGGPVSGG